ncbi:MAG: cysteine hydrolase family protein [Myxococcota bacterium]
MSTILVDVDTQYDFCDPSGALYVPESPHEAFVALVARAKEAGVPILGSVDTHAFDAWEFASNENVGPRGENPRFPDHCVKGTRGWLKVEGTLPDRYRFVPNMAVDDEVVRDLATELGSGRAQALYFEKEVYSLFVNPNAQAILEVIAERGATPLVAIVFGVATDYCVKAATLGLRERGYRTLVVEDAVAGISAAGVVDAWRAFTEQGAERIVLERAIELLDG